jgi:hypothetical protein
MRKFAVSYIYAESTQGMSYHSYLFKKNSNFHKKVLQTYNFLYCCCFNNMSFLHISTEKSREY